MEDMQKTILPRPGFGNDDRPPYMGEQHEGSYWAILYEDQDRGPDILIGEAAARYAYKRQLLNWNCRLFRQVTDCYGDEIDGGAK